MEGRAIARPNIRLATCYTFAVWASMEGRAIARPNFRGARGRVFRVGWLQWRAEQLPGQTNGCSVTLPSGTELQWRAEQLPGQTPSLEWGALSAPPASMEGRAIARPNLPLPSPLTART